VTKVAELRKKDPFAVVGEAMAAAADAVKKSTSDARQAASQAGPAVRSAIAQSVYIATYYASFGAVFAALTVSRMTPMDNAFGYGIRDGAAAARDIRTNSSGPLTKVATARTTARKRTDRRPGRTRPGSKTSASVVEAER
jgi:hypothetical protein